MKALLDELPATIVLPPIDAPRVRGAGAAPANLAAPEDLPQRLFFGDLDTSLCEFGEPGKWTAHYTGDAGGGTELGFDGDTLSLSLKCLGARIASASNAETIGTCLRFLAGTSQAPLDAAMKRWLTGRLNVQVIEAGATFPLSWHFPDGPMRELWITVPVMEMQKLLLAWEALRGQGVAGASLRGMLQLGQSSASYVEGFNDRRFSDPDWLHAETIGQYGLPPLGAPRREQVEEGHIAWTIHRRHYVCRIVAFLRDIPAILAHFHNEGFIGMAIPGSRHWPFGPEFAAVLIPPELAIAVERINWSGESGARRVVMPGPGDGLD